MDGFNNNQCIHISIAKLNLSGYATKIIVKESGMLKDITTIVINLIFNILCSLNRLLSSNTSLLCYTFFI